MPATISTDFVFGDQDESANVHSIDVAPMNKESVDSRTVITLQGKNGSGWTPVTVGNSDARFNVDKLHWKITPTIGKVSEATWHWNDPTNMPAAANTLPAITNVQIVGFAVTEGQSQLIPIAKLIDYGNSRPLPFAVPWDITTFKSYGVGADSLAVLGSQLNFRHNPVGSQSGAIGEWILLADARRPPDCRRTGCTRWRCGRSMSIAPHRRCSRRSVPA